MNEWVKQSNLSLHSYEDFSILLHSACMSTIQLHANDAGRSMVCSPYNENHESILVEHVLINVLTSRGKLREMVSTRSRAFGEGSKETVKRTELRTFFPTFPLPFCLMEFLWNCRQPMGKFLFRGTILVLAKLRSGLKT